MFFAAVNHNNYDHKQRTLKHRNTQNGSKSANHKSENMNFWTCKSKVLFPRGPLRWLMAAKNAIVSWLLNFRIRLFVKRAVNLFLWFRIYYSLNWECFDQSCVNWTETVHGTLHFLYLSHLLYEIHVKIFIMNRYISKSYTTSKNTIDQQYTDQSGGSCSVNYY